MNFSRSIFPKTNQTYDWINDNFLQTGNIIGDNQQLMFVGLTKMEEAPHDSSVSLKLNQLFHLCFNRERTP